MSTRKLLDRWHRQLSCLLPVLHGHQLKTLAAASFALARAQHCSLARLALYLPSAQPSRLITPQSGRRRAERLLANVRLPVETCMEALALHTLRAVVRRPGVHLRLLLDETPNGADLRALKLSLADAGRALPLLWICYRTGHAPAPMPLLLEQLLGRLERLLAQLPPVTLTLLADRGLSCGLSWPQLLDACRRRNWHVLLRLQHHTRVRLPSGQICRADALAPAPGRRFQGEVEVFKKAGWRRVHLFARWPRAASEPWLLLSSWPARAGMDRWYRRRQWQEQSFRDEKSAGLQWQRSRVRLPAHAAVLLLLLHLAQLWMMSLGHYLRARRLNRHFERRGRRELSLFQLGLRYFLWAIEHDLFIPTALHLPAAPRPPTLG